MNEEQVDELELQRATLDVLKSNYSDIELPNDDITSEDNKKLASWALDSSTRDECGKIKLPLLWNPANKHLLSDNAKLSKAILFSNLKKLRNDKHKLELLHNTFKQQEQ